MNWGFTKFDKEPIRNNTAFLVVFLALVLPMENVSSLCSCFFNSHNLSFALQEANELLIPITFHIQGTTMIQVKLRNYQIHCNRLRLVTRETSRLKSKLNECITRCCGIDSDTNLSDSPKTLIEAGADVKWENKVCNFVYYTIYLKNVNTLLLNTGKYHIESYRVYQPDDD